MIEECFLENENEEFGEQLLEEFEIIEKLGEGAFSKVYKVKHRNEMYALKVQEPYKLVDRLYQEAQILSTLEHPNIIQFYKTIESKRKIYFLIEYIEGQSLQNLIETQQLEEEQIRDIIQQISYAIAYIHKRGIIHRDLKPENILLDSEHRVKLIDFGLSFQTVKSTTHENCGTLIFMAPEALMKKEYFKSVDIWSLGIIQYMMFTNNHPFWNDDNRDTYIKKMKIQQQVQFPKNMNKKAISFFEKTAAWEPEARITAEQVLIHPWITGMSNQMPMSSKDIIQTFKAQNDFTQIIKSVLFVYFIKKYSHKRTIVQSQQLLPNKSQILIIPQRTPSTQQKLKTEFSQLSLQPPLSAHRSTQSRIQNNSSFCSDQTNQDQRIRQIKQKQQQFKLPPINTKSANNSPYNIKQQQSMFTFSPYKKTPINGELKKSQFKL